MAFSVPQMPLICNIYRGPWTARVLASSPSCNLAWGRRTAEITSGAVGDLELYNNFSQLLLTKGTDVRDISCAITGDVVECPAGSGRWYGVATVDDVGKGFSNEYRIAVLTKIYEQLDPLAFPGLFWPAPIP